MIDEKEKRANDSLLTMLLSETIRPLLGGYPPYVQSSALADLVAIWLAGHIVPDQPDATEKHRRELFDGFVDLVWKLVPVNEKMMVEEELKKRAKH